MRLDMNIFQIAAKYATNLMGIATPEELIVWRFYSFE